MRANLSFEQAPPISVPFRFFLLAPLFGIAAGVLLVLQGSEALASRWNPSTLALTHLFSVGFMLQAMCGALLQFVPVATGGNVRRPRLVANVAHPLLGLAAMVLITAFLAAQSQSWLFPLAGLLFALGLSLFIGNVGMALLQTPATGMTVQTLRLSLFGLVMTLLFGLLLVGMLGWQGRFIALTGWSLPRLVNTHAAWGLGGWALLLVMAVSYMVVPMFLLTPAYPARASRWLPLGLLAVLLVWSAVQFIDASLVPGGLAEAIVLPGLALAAGYALVTLWLQEKRRRRIVDPTFLFWRSAMLALLAILLSWLVLLAVPDLAQHPRSMVWLGVLAFHGVFVSVISGMLYKIVPFMIWLHLQKLDDLKTLPPNMKQMIPERRMRGQLAAHLLALALLLLAVLWPRFAPVAGGALALSFAWLEWNLLQALRIYVDFRREHVARAAGAIHSSN
ncbi:MAG: hypothetical protein KUL75_03935 [Sterolibacterium sp.]|nr:hypothetical protein [Sterolibacterium sp.]